MLNYIFNFHSLFLFFCQKQKVPSISLLDDVFRLKKNSLIITGFAAGTLWVLFSALLYIVEHDDYDHSIDAVPSYGAYFLLMY